MLGYGNRMPQTVRPRSARRMPAPLCLVVFCLTAIVVYCWGEEIRIHSSGKAKHTATAYVVERATKAGQSDVRIPIAATDDDPRRAEAAANARADDYVKERRADWQRRTARAYADGPPSGRTGETRTRTERGPPGGFPPANGRGDCGRRQPARDKEAPRRNR